MGNWIQYNEDEDRFDISTDDGETFVELDLSGHTLLPEPETPLVALRGVFKGLYLRTDIEAESTKIKIEGLEEWVSDDGQWVSDDLSNNTATITSSGAGGLDTGSEAASTWYEIYRIMKDDLTKNVLLHRAKNYALDANQSTYNSYGIIKTTTTIKLGQTFQVGEANKKIEFVDVNLARFNNPVGNVWAEIQDNGGTILATSQKLSGTIMSTSGVWVRFIFDSPYASFALSTTYRLVIAADYATSAGVNNILWNMHLAGTYANGLAQQWDGSSWTTHINSGYDFSFKIYLTKNESAVTMPTDYTKKCLLGYVYNNSGSNFVPFRKIDKIYKHSSSLTTLGAFTSTFPNLIDLSSIVPPVKAFRISLFYTNDGANSIVAAAGIPDGAVLALASYGDYGSILVKMPSSGTGAFYFMGFIMSRFQGIYAMMNQGTSNIYVQDVEY